MKYLKLSAFFALFAAMFAANSANASNSSGAAVTACKDHIAGLYTGDLSRKVKKIQTKGGEVRVKMRVTADGERFYAECLVSRDGEFSYTSDKELNNAIVSKDS